MKKTKILFICTLILALTCIFVGCSKKEQISSINLKDIDPEASIEMPMGKFDFSQYTVVVNYDSGKVEEVVLSESMISELDRLKFYQPGEHVITVSHGKNTCTFKISVKREAFGELKFPENNVFTYDGQEHGVELMGEIPANATVSYIGGNSFVNAGTYDVTAVVTCNGYVTERISTTVTIERAKYDIGNVTLESKEVVYDGAEHSIAISGELPEGIEEPIYYIDGNKVSGMTDVGEYKVTAVFPNNNPNYDMIPSLQATLTITPADYDMSDVYVEFENADGSYLFGAWKVYDGKAVVFDVDNGRELKNDVSISYIITDEDGNQISKSNKDTNIKNAGSYNIKIEFLLLDNKNYNPIEPMEITFDVDRAKYDVSDLLFDSAIVEYSGNPNTLSLELPKNLKDANVGVSYEYYRAGEYFPITENGENVNGVCDAGEYKVKAVFTVTDPNYKDISSVEATLVIEKKVLPSYEIEFDNTRFTYTGKAMLPNLGLENEKHLSVSEIAIYKLEGEDYVKVDEAVNAGVYRAEATVILADTQNYEFDSGITEFNVSGDFTIEKAEIIIEGMGFSDTLPSIVNRGEKYTIEFDSKNINGLGYQVTFYKIQGEDLLVAADPMVVAPESNGIIEIDLDSSKLDGGKYICAISVNPESSNFVLSDGEAILEYYFEFEVNEIVIDIDALFQDNISYEYNGRDLRRETFDNLDYEIRQYLDCIVWRVDEYSGGDWYESSYAGVVGYYRVQYDISVKSGFDYVKLLVNGQKVDSATVYHRFYIV